MREPADVRGRAEGSPLELHRRPCRLHVASTAAVDLATALRWAGPADGATALCWSARQVCWGRVDTGGVLRDPAGAAVDTEGLFEVRLFDGTLELRWLHQDGGAGPAVVLSEDPAALPEGPGRAELQADATVDSVRYLLWGTAGAGESPLQGWSTLREERVGRLEVPIRVRPGRRAVLVAREYVGSDDGTASPSGLATHTAMVIEERLLRLEETRG